MVLHQHHDQLPDPSFEEDLSKLFNGDKLNPGKWFDIKAKDKGIFSSYGIINNEIS